jgi:ankyrin repeat protein
MIMTDAEEFNNLYELIKKNDIKDIINILDQNPEFINKTDSHGNTLLILSCQYDKFELTKILIKKKADIHHRNNEGRDALLTAARTHGCVDLCKLLLENGANPNTADKLNAETPLFISAWFDNLNLCLLLISYGANLMQEVSVGSVLEYYGYKGYSDDEEIEEHRNKLIEAFAENAKL